MRTNALLFALAVLLGGLGGALGSIVGNAFGRTGLFAGGIAGGLLGAVATAAVARSRGWIPAGRFGRVAVATAFGFLVAAAIAVNTLSSPIGPVASTLLIGVAALLGARGGNVTPGA